MLVQQTKPSFQDSRMEASSEKSNSSHWILLLLNPQSISQAWVRPAESSSEAIDVPLKAQLIYQVTM